MIAKLITYGATRDEAADLQVAALDRFELEGVGHNIDFLSALMQHPRFREGRLTTGFIAEEFPDGFTGAAMGPALSRQLAAIAVVLTRIDQARAGQIDGKLNGAPPPGCSWVVDISGAAAPHHVDVTDDDRLVVDGEAVSIAVDWRPGQTLLAADIDGALLSVKVRRERGGWRFSTRGAAHRVRVYTPHLAELARHMIPKIPPDMSKYLLCPMPGLLTALHVNVGDSVQPGQPLAVVEAMKMENILRAERAATVKAVNFKPGESMAVDAPILEFE
jgi:propionyl-CoA carboxylase alpha chain